MKTVRIRTGRIQLDQFLKWAGAAQSGGEAKERIREGAVTVNGIVETRRGRGLVPGDRVGLRDPDETFLVETMDEK